MILPFDFADFCSDQRGRETFSIKQKLNFFLMAVSPEA